MPWWISLYLHLLLIYQSPCCFIFSIYCQYWQDQIFSLVFAFQKCVGCFRLLLLMSKCLMSTRRLYYNNQNMYFVLYLVSFHQWCAGNYPEDSMPKSTQICSSNLCLPSITFNSCPWYATPELHFGGFHFVGFYIGIYDFLRPCGSNTDPIWQETYDSCKELHAQKYTFWLHYHVLFFLRMLRIMNCTGSKHSSCSMLVLYILHMQSHCP